jgi:hypothetical protein
MGHYRTVFEITQKGFDWWFPAAGLGGIAFGAIFIKIGKARKWFGYYMVGFSILWTLLVAGSMSLDYYKAHMAYRTGQFSVVEGPVEDFHPMPYTGHQDECFSVQRKTFCYSDYDVTAGFNNSMSHGGPIRAGLPVRIAYYKQEILRIDVRQEF